MPIPGVAAAIAAVLLAAPAPARAQRVDLDALPDITDRDYSIDLYSGAALGSGEIVGMGGAALASAEGSAGMIFNPASPAVRPATSSDKWAWDWHVDWLNPEIGTDFDNNGLPATTVSECSVFKLGECAYFTGGMVGQYRQWAIGFSGSYLQSSAGKLKARASIAQVILARSFWAEQIVAGVGARVGTFGMLVETGTNMLDPLFSLTGSSFEAGGLWRPAEQDFRVGASIGLPVAGRRPEVTDCDPMNCMGYVLPQRVRAPWRTGVGVAWRFGPTPWNRKVKGDWRDEKSVLLAGDVIVTGSVPNGYGLEAFAAQKLQPSGRDTVFSVRAGAEYEWLPGRLRIRGGGYWEPARFLDENGDSVPGRIHVTSGLDVRVWSFCFWGDRYRARLSITADAASHYGNGALSIGFWH